MAVAIRSSTVTAGNTDAAGRIHYPDVYGILHTVTNGQTFILTSADDDGTNFVRYYILPVATTTAMTTTDGYKIVFASGETAAVNGFAESTELQATTATPHPIFNWTIPIRCPVTGIVQYWRVTSITMSDLDFSSAGTMTVSMTDQFDNEMTITAIPVGQAA